MNVLFISLVGIFSVETNGIYTDLLREFIKNGHSVYILSSVEQLMKTDNLIVEEPGAKIVKVKTGRIQKTNIIEKGINTILIEPRFKRTVKKYFKDIKFDLVLYPTPPITFTNVIKYVKKRDGAKSYLMLKDIFPQNAVDIGMLSKRGLKGIIYRYFRHKEKKLYAISDHIGCMSPANVEYLLKHNPEIPPEKVEICPNSVEVRDMSLTAEETISMREKYGLPIDKKIFVYGGNLGKPQGVPFIIECLKSQMENPDAYFLIVGSGTEYGKLENFFEQFKPTNMKLMKSLPKDDYDRMIAACDVGMIFLDHRFTIPNFPSRLLSYMQAKLPVLACTDPNTDIGKIIADGGFGWWCESDDVQTFCETITTIEAMESIHLASMRDRAFQYLKRNYSSEQIFELLKQHLYS